MVHTYVVGCGDVGKTTLIRKLQEELPRRKIHRIEEVARNLMARENISGDELRLHSQSMWNLQSKIIVEQIKQESKFPMISQVISDRSFLDAIVYGLQLYEGKFSEIVVKAFKPKNVPGSFDSNEDQKLVFKPFCTKLLSLEMMKEAVKRYRKSLFVLLHHPWKEGKKLAEDDGTRYLLKRPQVEEFTAIYVNLLRFLRIPFIEIKHQEISDRVNVLKEALDGKTDFQFESLEWREKLSDRKTADKTLQDLETQCQFLSLPFYIEDNKESDIDTKLPLITISHKVTQSWTQLDPGKINRIVDKYGTANLFILHFEMRILPIIAEVMLKNGVLINGEMYSLLGCSSSGLKDRKCYLWRGSNLDADRVREENGCFSKLKTTPKQMTRFSLLLSNVQKTRVEVTENQIILEDDVEKDGFNFTDGCGGIDVALARKTFKEVYAQEKKYFMQKMKEDELAKSKRLLEVLEKFGYQKAGSTLHECYKKTACPSVLQIRFQGYKGVLALDAELSSESTKNHSYKKKNRGKKSKQKDAERRSGSQDVSERKLVKVRPSMRKFETDQFPFICVCAYSRPYTFGFLNTQYIRLLSALGVPDEVFMRKQQELLRKVRNMRVNMEDAVSLFQWNNQFDIAQLLVWYKNQAEKTQDRGAALEEVKDFLDKKVKILQEKLSRDPEKLRILIPEARNLFGICEPTRKDEKPLLKEGQCFLRVTINDEPYTVTGPVVVSKNPCYLPSDVRVLEAVTCIDLEQGNYLVDCIVYPLVGKIPHSAEIAGSDLDGDNYFVCWDKELIPPQGHEKPYGYPAFEASAPSNDLKRTLSEGEQAQLRAEEMSKYLSIQSEAKKKVGRISNLYAKWANKNGIKDECIQLGQLFARAVDSAKSGERITIPKCFNINADEEEEAKFVWQKMMRKAVEFKENFKKDQLKKVDEISQEFLVDIISERNSNLSEFAKFRLVMQFLDTPKSNGLNEGTNAYEKFIKSPFRDLINFGLFTQFQKGCAIDDFRFPIQFVMNALSRKSQLLSSYRLFHDFATRFNLHNENVFPWQVYFQWNCADQASDLSQSLQQLIYRAINKYTDVLVAIQVPDGVCFVLRFEKQTGSSNAFTSQVAAPETQSCQYRKSDIQIPSILERDLEQLGMHATCYFHSPHFNYSLKYHLKDANVNFKLDLKDDVLQLYRGVKTRTFIQFKLSESIGSEAAKRQATYPKCVQNAMSRKNEAGKTFRSIDGEENNQMHSISVDLTSFYGNARKGSHPLVRKTPVVALETFVFNRKSEFKVDPIGVAYLDTFCGNLLNIVYNSDEDNPLEFGQYDSNDCQTKSLEEFETLWQMHCKIEDGETESQDDKLNSKKLTTFLDDLSFKLRTRPMSTVIEKKLSKVVDSMAEDLKNDSNLLVNVVRLLSSLGLFDVIENLLQIISVCKVTSKDGTNGKNANLICASKLCADWKLLAVNFCLNRSSSQKLLEAMFIESNNNENQKVQSAITNAKANALQVYVLDSVKQEHALLVEEFEEKWKQLLFENSRFFKKNQNFRIPLPNTIWDETIVPQINSNKRHGKGAEDSEQDGNENEVSFQVWKKWFLEDCKKNHYFAIDTPETIGNLKVVPKKLQSDCAGGSTDNTQERGRAENESKDKTNENEITFRRQEILQPKIRYWSNQFVILTRQQVNPANISPQNTEFSSQDDFPNDSHFPPLSMENEEHGNVARRATGEDEIINATCKEQVVCLGRVVEVKDVPASITIQVVSESDHFKSRKRTSFLPDVLRRCVFVDTESEEDAPRLLWRLTLLQANVVTYSRITEALKVLAAHNTSDHAKREIETQLGTHGDAIDKHNDVTEINENRKSTKDDTRPDKEALKLERGDVSVTGFSGCGSRNSSDDLDSGNGPSLFSSNTKDLHEVARDSQNMSEEQEKFEKSFDNDMVSLLVYPTMMKIYLNKLSEIEPPLQSIVNSGLEHESFQTSLNKSQRLAVELARNNKVSLIHGPPGTGKSTTACAIVRDVLLNYGYNKVLVCAETNLAVDNLLLKFAQTSSNQENDLHLLRLNSQQGRESRNPDVEMDPTLQELSLEAKINKIMGSNYRKFTTFRTSAEKKAAQKIIQESRVVFTTCAGAGDPLLDHTRFEFVLVDEATMSREATSLCALAHGCQHLVLIGDPNQLGPTLRSAVQSETEVEETVDTLFHKFHAIPDIFKMAFLDTQHRMHSLLAQFPSQEFYRGELKSVANIDEFRRFDFNSHSKYIQETNISKWWPFTPYHRDETTRSPLCFVNVSNGKELRRGTSYCNESEAKICCKIWLDILLVKAVESYRNIAILTLYKGQVEKLKEHFTVVIKDLKNRFPLAENLPKTLPEINSVDSYQGRENDVILVSTVRTKKVLGFSGDKNRINVLLTRGKKMLCVIGNKDTLMTSDCWQNWLGIAPSVEFSRVEQKAGTSSAPSAD